MDEQEININRKDEDALLNLFNEHPNENVDKFIEELQKELNDLETSNVEGIMNSEENTIKLISMLDKAVEEIQKIDERLQIYEDKISAVGDAVKKVGNEDNFIQIQENNQMNLLEILEKMITQLDISDDEVRLLKECDLTSTTKINKCVKAANSLLKSIDSTVFNSGLMKMKAYEEQKRYLENLKLTFSSASSSHIKNSIMHSFNQHSNNYKEVENKLPPHKAIFDHLIMFKDLIPLLHKSSVNKYYDEVKIAYITASKQIYSNEIIPFCMCARVTILKTEKSKPSAVASMENIKNQIQKSLDKGHGGDVFSLKIDQPTKDILKNCFRKLVKQLSDIVQLEENFCHEFFNIKIENNQSKADLPILSEIFKNIIEEQIKIVIETIQKLEPMMIIFIYSELLYHVLVCFNNKNFMHQPLIALLRVSKEKCDEYTNEIKEAIKDYKVNKRERIGIIKYILYFEEFVREAEICWEPIKEKMYEKLCNIYQILVNEIFIGIESIAQESQKTSPDVVRFQNYHQMNHIMRTVNGLKDSKESKYAKERFNVSKQDYIKEHFGRPLEKLHYFFEKVEKRVESGVKYEDISYQMDLSMNNLREIIKEYPGKEVKKGLESLYRKVEKHLGENTGLMQVIWRDMTDEFIRQYKNYENLIRLCYPGQKIMLEFSADEVIQFFEIIARSH